MQFAGVPVAALTTQQLRFVLDRLSVLAAAAYGLRRLRAGYTGPAINVRRSSDNAAVDIKFLFNGDLDIATLLAFVGSGSGYVTTWYDQSSNARNATQTTATAQPMIVNAGALVTLGGRPGIKFDGSSSFFSSAYFENAITQSVKNVVISIPSATNSYTIIWNDRTTGKPSLTLSQQIATNATNGIGFFVDADSTAVGVVSSSTINDGVPRVLTGAWLGSPGVNAAPSQFSIFINGSQQAVGTATTGTPTAPFTGSSAGSIIGRSSTGSTNFLNATLSELMIFSQLVPATADRQTLERSQGSYFGVSVA